MSNHHPVTAVLVVEDEPLVRMHGIDILKDAGFDVFEAADADEALLILGDGTEVHLLFSGVDMPGSMDGLQLAHLVHERWPHIHLLLTSGHHKLRDTEMPDAGKFVRKPWTSEALVRQVREFV